ncbi:MAG: hypothetical protein EP329_19180 [Deltaproteobacteria bacterium]|nr:MAG: hypothetical protein EP329_19180 [Deltaproteobacteria bacterium]
MNRFSPRPSTLLALVAVLPALAAGCGGAKLDGTLVDGVLTFVEPTQITAGGSATVTCELLGADEYTQLTTTFTVTPDGAVLINGGSVTTNVAGTYHIACAVPEAGVVDPVGVDLVVGPGKPVAVKPVLDDNPIAAGTVTGVRCAAVDQFGNPVSETGTPYGDPPLIFASGTVGSQVAGSFEIQCDSADFPSLPRESTFLEVVPGDVVGVELKVDPDRTAFPVGAAARFYWVTVDQYGNAVADAPGVFVAPEDPALQVMDEAQHRYRFLQEGRFTFRVTLSAPYPALTDDLTIAVDSTPPVLDITFPERGATLAGAGQAVVVKGTITDTWAGVDEFTINGDDVTVAADGSFAFPLPPHWGVNMIDARAEDAAGNAVKLTPTFQYSEGYRPFVDADAEGLKFDDGMVMLLGQEFLDDGDHAINPIDDIATLLEVLLGNAIDLSTLIDDALSQFEQTIPIVDSTQTIGIDNFSWLEVHLHGQIDITLDSTAVTGIDTPQIGIDSRTGGLDLDIVFGDALQKAIAVGLKISAHASFTVTVDACSFIGCAQVLPFGGGSSPELYGDATLLSGLSVDAINLIAHTNIAKTPGSPLVIDFADFDFSLEGLDINPVEDVVLSLGVLNVPGFGNQTLSFALSDVIDLNGLIGGVIDPVADLLTTVAPMVLNPIVEAVAGPLLAGLFDIVNIDTSFEIPPILGEKPDSYYLDFYTDLSSVAFTDPGGKLGISAGFYSEKGVERDPLGAILRAGCLEGASDALVWNWDPSVGIGLRSDMLNAAFFGAWWTGYLDGPLDVSALAQGSLPIPISGLQLNLRWLLPPTLDTCTTDPSALGVQIGDLFVELTGTALGSPIRVTLYADLGFDAGFVTSTDGLSLMIGDLNFSDFEVIEEDAGALGEAFDLRNLVEEALPGILAGFLVGQEFGPFELPATDLSAAFPSLPPGTSIGLTNLGVLNQDGYVIVGGDLGQ